MQKKWLGWSLIPAAAALATVWLEFKPEYRQTAPSHTTSASGNHSEKNDPSVPEPHSEQQQSLLNNTKVQQYLQRQTEKQALQDYFNNPDNDAEAAKKAWLLIEKTEAEGGVLAYEALHLKMAWLEKNNPDRASFEAAAKDLMTTYQEKSLAAAEKYNPENTPAFKNYKAQELEIIQEVNRLETIPKGLTREAYLRERLLAARIAAYGETTTEQD